ncbi:hypothetical protein ACFWPK_28705 [Nocardia sp. NPDC058519]|uniref:hypothetical protein n=1 Tax=unclassified Nocardia TaxID=2637762 RepID=UPI0036570DB6
MLVLYFVGDASAGYQAFGSSWILDDGPWQGGTEVRGDPEEVIRWTDAQRVAEAALRDAEAQLFHESGLVEVNHEGMRWLSREAGWRAFGRWLRELASRRAYANYRLRNLHIREVYQPVLEEIDARVREAEQQARKQREQIHNLAARARWGYTVDRDAGVVHIFRKADANLGTTELLDKLLEVRRNTGVSELRWDDESRAGIARDSGVDFETWWRAVTPYTWGGSHAIPQTELDQRGRTVHVSAHTSFGSFGGIH